MCQFELTFRDLMSVENRLDEEDGREDDGLEVVVLKTKEKIHDDCQVPLMHKGLKNPGQKVLTFNESYYSLGF